MSDELTPSIEVLRWVKEQGGIEAVKKRLMPEGMEWPKVDGEPVDFNTFYGPSLGALEAVSIYNNGACEVMSHDGIVKNATEIHVFKPKVLDADWVEIREGDVLYRKSNGHMVKVAEIHEKTFTDADDYVRPGDGYTHRAPVFAADGEPLEVGQTVYVIANGKTHHVTEVDAVSKRFRSMEQVDGSHWLDPMCFTHQRPVLDADGVPIREGDTVWDAATSAGPFTVREIERSDDPDEPEDIVWCGEHAANGFKVWRIADQLTHAKPEPPDSWERLEEDAKLGRCDYNKAHGYPACCIGCDGLPLSDSCSEIMARDLVRRAKKLAGVDND